MGRKTPGSDKPILSDDARRVFALVDAIVADHEKSTCSGVGGETAAARLTASSIRGLVGDALAECEAVGSVVDPVSGEPPRLGSFAVAPGVEDDDLAKLASHVEVAAGARSHVEFDIRYGAGIDLCPHVSYPNAGIRPAPTGFYLDRRVFAVLLAEAEALCGGTRSTRTITPEWMPAGVRDVTIRWLAPRTGLPKDRFGISLRFEGTA